MKIQHISRLANQINPTKNTKISDSSFAHVLSSHIKKDNPKEDTATQSNPMLGSEQIDNARSLALSSKRQVTMAGLQELTKDAFSNISAQILQEIESLCDDETGKGIDMKLLDELLELYKEA